jgi:hypothetical protein
VSIAPASTALAGTDLASAVLASTALASAVLASTDLASAVLASTVLANTIDGRPALNGWRGNLTFFTLPNCLCSQSLTASIADYLFTRVTYCELISIRARIR